MICEENQVGIRGIKYEKDTLISCPNKFLYFAQLAQLLPHCAQHGWWSKRMPKSKAKKPKTVFAKLLVLKRFLLLLLPLLLFELSLAKTLNAFWPQCLGQGVSAKS